MQEIWRTVLQRIFDEDPHEKQRIAREMKIDPVSLTRWATTETKPRLSLLVPLVKAVPPAHQAELRTALEKNYPGFMGDDELLATTGGLDAPTLSEESSLILDTLHRFIEGESSSEEIPIHLYSQVLALHASVRPEERFWQMCHPVLETALRQLDHAVVGMELLVARCIPPATNKVHSLRESIGVGTPPWHPTVEERQFFLGLESLAGYVVSTRRVCVIQDVHEDDFLALGKQGKSTAAFPIQQEQGIAGALVCTSTQRQHFTSSRLEVLQKYTHLLALAFHPQEFFGAEAIELRCMPPREEQGVLLSQFRTQITQEMSRALQQGSAMTIVEAELHVRHRLEATLTQLHPERNTVSPTL